MPVMNLVESIRHTLELEMARDKSVVLLGEDVGKNGGVFRVTEGLWSRFSTTKKSRILDSQSESGQKFGDERVIDTPLAEVGIIGISLGLAVAGMKPIPEVQFDGFSIAMFDQLYNHVSRMRKRTQGRYGAPLVLRVPHGGGIKAYEHHSESLETYFCHMPGLKVVAPSSPYNAKGLLISAIRDPDPVIFLEPKRIYRAIKEEVPEEEYTIPIGKAEIAQEGADITLVSWGAPMRTCRQAAEQLAGKYSIEIIDLLTLSPLDRETIVNSVKKTGRCIVIHEAQKTCGFGAELAATVQEQALLSMKAPVMRVTGYDIPMPLAKLESYQIPDTERIADGIEKAMEF